MSKSLAERLKAKTQSFKGGTPSASEAPAVPDRFVVAEEAAKKLTMNEHEVLEQVRKGNNPLAVADALVSKEVLAAAVASAEKAPESLISTEPAPNVAVAPAVIEAAAAKPPAPTVSTASVASVNVEVPAQVAQVAQEVALATPQAKTPAAEAANTEGANISQPAEVSAKVGGSAVAADQAVQLAATTVESAMPAMVYQGGGEVVTLSGQEKIVQQPFVRRAPDRGLRTRQHPNPQAGGASNQMLMTTNIAGDKRLMVPFDDLMRKDSVSLFTSEYELVKSIEKALLLSDLDVNRSEIYRIGLFLVKKMLEAGGPATIREACANLPRSPKGRATPVTIEAQAD